MNIFQKLKLNKILRKGKASIVRNYTSYPDYIKNDLRIIDIVVNGHDCDKISIINLIKYLRQYPEKINNENLSVSLKQEDYIKLCNEIDGLIDYLFDSSILCFIALNTNIKLSKEKYSLLNNELKIKLINEKIEYYYIDIENNLNLIRYLKPDVQLKIYELNKNIFKYLSDEIKIQKSLKDDSVFTLLTRDLQLKVLLENNSKLQICEDIKLIEVFLEEYKNKKDIDLNNINQIIDLEKRGFNLSNLINNKYFIDSKFKNKNKLLNLIINRSIDIRNYSIYQFLNHEILNKNSEDDLIEYLLNPNTKKLENILINTYGVHVKKIFKVRPNLNIQTIDSYEIFKEEIFNKLGLKFINQVLNYKIENLNYFIPIVLSNEILMNSFVKLYNFMKFEIGDSIETLNLSVQKFINLSNILKTKDFDKLLKEKSLLLYNYLFDDNYSLSIENETSLNNYLNKKGEDIKKSVHLEEKVCLLFGIESNDLNMILSFMFRDIDTDNIITKEDQEVLQIIYLLSNLKDNDLNKFNLIVDIIKGHPKMFNMLNVKKICKKIKKIYNSDFARHVTNDDKIKSEKFDVNTVDGVDIIEFTGQDFTFLVSDIASNGSGTYNKLPNYFPEECINRWLTLENGISTISTSLLGETVLFPELYRPDSIYFGFNNFYENQIFAFIPFDAGASHNKRCVNPGNDIYFHGSFKETLYTLNKKGYRSCNETTIKRYNDDGSRVLPDFILVYSDNPRQLEIAIELVREFRKIGHSINIYRIYPDYYKDKVCMPDNRVLKEPKIIKTQLLEEVNEIINSDVKRDSINLN